MSFPFGIPIRMWAAALVDHTTPAYTWQTGQFAASITTDHGAGDLSHSFGTDYTLDSAQCMVFFQQNGAAAASGLTSFGVAHTSDTVKRITVLREAALGATSALTDVDYWMAWYKRQV